jgi:15-cis-phytoene synthase / lycopene beta-cyclase
LLQILINKPVLFAAHIRDESVPEAAWLRRRKHLGLVLLLAATAGSLLPDWQGRTGTYMKLIFLWAAPVLLFLWSISYQLLLSLPRSKTWLPIWLPTLYLWIVDTIALRRGTWSITSGTKLGIHVWPHLEIEEAVFFLVTNTLVVWGSFAFDNAVAIQDAFPGLFPDAPSLPSPLRMLKSLLIPTTKYDQARLDGLQQALTVLSKKSRSFYLASGVFSGRLRIDLILLYGFCRVADDLIDDAPSANEAQDWIDRFTAFLDTAYVKPGSKKNMKEALKPFPAQAQSVLELLPVDRLPSEPLYSLLEGFKMDSKFGAENEEPVKTTADLQKYANCVAATIGQLCLSLVYYHDPNHEKQTEKQIKHCIGAGTRMGRALQYINIARDVTTDAENGRCYIPQDWFESKSSKTATAKEILLHRERILAMAFDIYAQDRDAIEELPRYARDGIRVAVESYMEIGRVLHHRLKTGQSLDFAGGGKKGKASVPRLRRLLVGWKAMSGIRGSIARGNVGS